MPLASILNVLSLALLVLSSWVALYGKEQSRRRATRSRVQRHALSDEEVVTGQPAVALQTADEAAKIRALLHPEPLEHEVAVAEHPAGLAQHGVHAAEHSGELAQHESRGSRLDAAWDSIRLAVFGAAAESQGAPPEASELPTHGARALVAEAAAAAGAASEAAPTGPGRPAAERVAEPPSSAGAAPAGPLAAATAAAAGAVREAPRHAPAPGGEESGAPAEVPSQVIQIEVPLEEVPMMSEANIVVSESTPNKMSTPASGSTGVDLLMAQDCGKIIPAMAQSGWVVKTRDEAKGQFDMYLPSVDQRLPMGSVEIPAPHFLVTVRDSDEWMAYEAAVSAALEAKEQPPTPPEERLIGSMVLQNGKDIFKVNLGFPINTTLSISAAGLAYARVGRSGSAAYLGAEVDVGMKLPGLPGLTKIMQLFVKNYAAQSVQDCANALSGAADKLSAESEANSKSMLAVGIAGAAALATEVDIVSMASQAGSRLMQGATELSLQAGPEAVQLQEALDTIGTL